MRVLGWNCRGICQAVTVRALAAQIKRARPDVVFLSETKANKNRMDYVKKFVNFDNSCVVEAKGYAGGLCIMWKNGLAIKEVVYDKNLIVVKVADQSVEWMLIGFYGPPYKSKKKKAWGNLFAFLKSHQGPWACIGDSNFIINDEEQFGGKKGGPSATNYLKELLFKPNTVDLGYSGNKFTWVRGKCGNSAIKRRLDRGGGKHLMAAGLPKSNHHPSGCYQVRPCPNPSGHKPM